MLKITIPQPCHEDWNKMRPNEQGRHCSSCAKTVVDFTGMSDDEVKYFFLNRKEENTCGRFRQTQLHQIVIDLPQNIFNIEMPAWKRFLVACLIVFSSTLFSCDTKINGEPVQTEQGSQPNKKQQETNKKPDGMVGGILVLMDSIVEQCPVTVGKPIAPDIIQDEIIGDLVIAEPKPEKTKQVNTVVITKTIYVQDSFITGIIATHILKKAMPDSVVNATKTKNPPKADSIDCDKMIYY